MVTKIDTRQSRNRAALPNIGAPADTTLDSILTAIDTQSGSSTGNSAQDRNIKLIGGGTWLWSGNDLTLSADAYIQVPGITNERNTILANTISLAVDGDAAFVTIVRDGTGANSLTVSVAQIDAITSTENTYIIARRIGNTINVGNTFSLENDERLELDGALAEINRYFSQMQIVPHKTDPARVVISGINTTKLSGVSLTQTLENFVLDFAGAEINFSTGTIYKNDGITVLGENFTPTTIPAGSWIWYSITLIAGDLNADNTLASLVKVLPADSTGVSKELAAKPVYGEGLGIGLVAIQRNAGDTGNEAIAYENIMQLGFGSGGGGGSGKQLAFDVLLAGEALSKNDAIYISRGDTNGDTGRIEGKAYKLDITNENRHEWIGNAKEDYAIDVAIKIVSGGILEDFGPVDKAIQIFASETVPGSWQTTYPTTTGYGIQQLGVSDDTGERLIINGALSSTLVIVDDGVPLQDAFTADQIGFVAGFTRETDPDGFISALNKTIGKTTANYSGNDYQDLYKHIWGLSGVQVEAVATKPGFTVLAAAKGAGWETDWDTGVNIAIDLRDEFLRFSGDTRDAGNHQDDAFQGHWHESKASSAGGVGQAAQTAPTNVKNNAYTWTTEVQDAVTDGVNGTPRTAAETRSSNTSVNPFIRYKNDTRNIIHGEVGTVNQYQTETKFLAASTSTSGILPDLTSSDLVVGKGYEVNLQALLRVNVAASSVGIEIYNGVKLVGKVEHKSDSSGTTGYHQGSVVSKFTAISTSLTFVAINATNGQIYGDGTENRTYTQLTRRTEYDTKYIAMEAEEVKKIRSVRSSVEKVVGEWIDGSPLYEKSYSLEGLTSGQPIDSALTYSAVTPRNEWVLNTSASVWYRTLYYQNVSALTLSSSGLSITISNPVYSTANFTIQYTKN